MFDLSVKYNELTAEQFIELWETVWGDGPTLEQTELAMKHTLFRVSIWDGDCIVAMARMNACIQHKKTNIVRRIGLNKNGFSYFYTRW